MDLETFLVGERGAGRPVRSGYVAIVGRPNVGKSTLMNAMVGRKVAITTAKPQTTRHRILGVCNRAEAQIVFVDTPGIHEARAKAMNRYLNRTAHGAVEGVDAVLLVIEAGRWREDDAAILARLAKAAAPLLLVVNKMDRMKDKSAALPFIQARAAEFDYADIVPLSALKRDNLAALARALMPFLPHDGALFPDAVATDKSERFMAAEVVREQLTMRLNQELPYALTVEIERFQDDDATGRTLIDAVIYVDRPNQKQIVIGKGGAMLRQVGSDARQVLNRLFNRRVHLALWVKVKQGWSDNERVLRSLGYE